MLPWIDGLGLFWVELGTTIYIEISTYINKITNRSRRRHLCSNTCSCADTLVSQRYFSLCWYVRHCCSQKLQAHLYAYASLYIKNEALNAKSLEVRWTWKHWKAKRRNVKRKNLYIRFNQNVKFINIRSQKGGQAIF